MDPILTIDIGAGTTDTLVFFPDSGRHYKAVAISAIKKTAENVLSTQSDLLVTGTVMGGGEVSKAVVQHARSHRVYMTSRAAQTVNDNLEKVREKGVAIVSESEMRSLQKSKPVRKIKFGDLSPDGIKSLLTELGVGWNFSYVAGAVQDHGVCPESLTTLDFRHQVMKERIKDNPSPERFLFSYDEIPEYLTRMKATGSLLSEIPHKKLFMMDTGVAAIVGGSLDPRLQECTHFIIVDIGNSHTLGAVLSEGLIGGFFEYHTNGLTSQVIEQLLINLAEGKLAHQDIVAEGGHGAYIRSCPGINKIEKIVVTGPRRREIMRGTKLEYIEGAPLGDNMMTGTAGRISVGSSLYSWSACPKNYLKPFFVKKKSKKI